MWIQAAIEQAKALPDFLKEKQGLPLDQQRLWVWERVIEIITDLQKSVTWIDTWQPLIDGKLKSLWFQVPDKETLTSEIEAFIKLLENISRDKATKDISSGSNTIQ